MRGDITTADVDVIVNAANPGLLGGGGVDGAIHRAAGPSILAECRELRRTTWPDGLPTGRAVATTAGELDATWVIHTVGPVYSASAGEEQEQLLASCYRESLRLAADLGAASIAFPAISTGIFGYPVEEAAEVALGTVRNGAERLERVHLIRFALFGESDLEVHERVLSGLP